MNHKYNRGWRQSKQKKSDNRYVILVGGVLLLVCASLLYLVDWETVMIYAPHYWAQLIAILSEAWK